MSVNTWKAKWSPVSECLTPGRSWTPPALVINLSVIADVPRVTCVGVFANLKIVSTLLYAGKAQFQIYTVIRLGDHFVFSYFSFYDVYFV